MEKVQKGNDGELTRIYKLNEIERFCDGRKCADCPLHAYDCSQRDNWTNELLDDAYTAIHNYCADTTEPSQEAKVDVVAYAKDYIPTYCRFNQKAKADAGKLPMNLVPTQISRDIAQVRQYGNEKYGDPDNWRKVEKLRYVAALERHLLAYKDYLNGDDDGFDKESGIEHYKHMACNMAFICEMERWERNHE